MSSSSKEEIIQISLGSTANSITAHLLNLQGLACTTSSSSGGEEEKALCNVTKTHEISSNSDSNENIYVPRILFVDGRDSFDIRRSRGRDGGGVKGQEEIQAEIFSGDGGNNGGSYEMSESVLGWTAVHEQQQEVQNRQQQQGENVFSWDGKIDIFQKPQSQPKEDQKEEEEEDALAIFQNAASILSSHTSSRYRAPSRYTSTTLSSSNDRHMVWDSDEEEEEELSEEMRQQLEYQKQQRQYQNIQTASTNLQNAWDTLVVSQPNIDDVMHWSNYWMYPHPSFSSYALPLPFHTSVVSTHTNLNADVQGVLSSFHAGFNTASNSTITSLSPSWRSEVVSESIRHLLEKCDVLRGINLMVDNGEDSGTGFYAGLTGSICQELRDECKSAKQFVNWIHSSSSSSAEEDGESSGAIGGSLAENAKRIAKYRRGISQGLSLSTLCEHADVVLPLNLPTDSSDCRFQASGRLAAVLECCTLFYRLNSSSSSSSSSNCIGLQSGYLTGGSGGPYETCSSLSFQEFISCLKPSDKHCILELDGLYSPLSSPSTSSSALQTANALPSFMTSNIDESSSLKSKLIQGTSIERALKQRQEEEWRKQGLASTNWNSKARRRMQMMGRTPDVDPGLWMEGIEDGGLLSSLSPTSSGGRDDDDIGGKAKVQRRGRGDIIIKQRKEEMKRTRSLHHHFALSASFRPSPPPPQPLSFASFRKNQSMKKEESSAVSTYLTPIMESLGIRYRPEISSSVVVPQSIYDLTSSSVGGGGSTAAGMYWPSIFSSSTTTTENTTTTTENTTTTASYLEQAPILSLLGNTTRSYPFIQSVVQDFTSSLSRFNTGHYNKDVTEGLVPEYDDCEESMEYCKTLLDCYEPPLGSGLMDDDDDSSADGGYFDGNED